MQSAAVIGGCSLSGGKRARRRGILGAIIMASLDNGMSMLGIEAFWQYMVKGAILIIAVGAGRDFAKGEIGKESGHEVLL